MHYQGCFLADIVKTFMFFLLPDSILELLRLPSKLALTTALQVFACFLVQLLANFATSSSGGAKTEYLYNDFDFDTLKAAFCGIELTETSFISL